MRDRIGTSLSLALALTAAIVTGAHADSRGPRNTPKLHVRGEPFTVSGSCTGTAEGEVRVDGTSYRLDPEALIYEAGRGFVPAGTSFNYRNVSLTGVKVRGTFIVYSVLIRADGSPSLPAGRSPVRMSDESRPR